MYVDGQDGSTPERLLLRLNGKRMLVMLPHESRHAELAAAAITMLVVRRRGRSWRRMEETEEEYEDEFIINAAAANEEGQEF